jgi:hypothetical protein
VLDAPEALAKTEVALLDRIEQHRAVELTVERVAEGGIAFELVDAHHGLEMLDDVPSDVGHDVLGVLQRARDDVVGVARDVGDEQTAAVGARGHELTVLPGDGGD